MELGLAYVSVNKESYSLHEDLGVSNLYNSLRWCNVQPESDDQYTWGTYDFEFSEEKRYGLNSVRSISHTPIWSASERNNQRYWTNPPKSLDSWIKFIGALVTRYPGRAWTIWAEPDNYPPRESEELICFTGSAEEYGEMLKTAYIEAKRRDPHCVIGVGGLVGATLNGNFPYKIFNGDYEDRLVFLDFLQSKNYLRFSDFIGADCYAYGYGGLQNVIKGISKIRSITKRKELWIMETGCKMTRTDKIDAEIYKAQYGHETVTQETVAGFLMSVCRIAEKLDIPKVFWLTLQDSDWGLINRHGKKHLAYDMFKSLSRCPGYLLDVSENKKTPEEEASSS